MFLPLYHLPVDQTPSVGMRKFAQGLLLPET